MKAARDRIAELLRMLMELNNSVKIKVLILSDILFLAIQAPMFILAFKNSPVSALLFCCLLVLIGIIEWAAFTARGYLWLRVVSGGFVGIYFAFMAYSFIGAMTHVDWPPK